MPAVKRIKLSYRISEIGGEVRLQPKLTPDDEGELARATHLVLLIHGYNNDTQDADQAYAGFHARQRELAGDDSYALRRTFVEVYWPGDAAWGIASVFFYMGSIRHAILTAERLGNYLSQHTWEYARIDIVAHSMGCRLATELLRTLQDRLVPPLLERIVFMAGAVPTFMLERRAPLRRLRPAYDKVLREGSRSLYSGSDIVLSFAFPAGQTLARGDEGFLPTALGHRKWTDPTVPGNLDQQPNDGAGHSDYWGWNTKPKALACARFAAREVHNYLQFPSAGSRMVTERTSAENSPLETRSITTERTLITRALTVYE